MALAASSGDGVMASLICSSLFNHAQPPHHALSPGVIDRIQPRGQIVVHNYPRINVTLKLT